MQKSFELNGFHIGSERSNALIIAEIAQAHHGSLGVAHAYIDAVAAAGADAVKFQTHFANEESTLDEPFRVNFSTQDVTRYDYWRRMEFTPEQWQGLRKHATDQGLLFLSSAFSVKAVHLLNDLGMPAWKVGSGEVNTPDLINAMLETRKPILLSTGMSSYEEIDVQVAKITSSGVPLALMQCTTMYPTPLECVGLNVITELRDRYFLPTGLSDHSGQIHPGMAALSMGTDLLEVHVVFDKREFGPDVPASLTIDELKMVVEMRNALQSMFENPVNKEAMAKELEPVKSVFSKSVALVSDQVAGTILDPSMLTLKKPGTGIQHHMLDRLVGRTLVRDVSSSRLLRIDDYR